jgi:hypothetical protein
MTFATSNPFGIRIIARPPVQVPDWVPPPGYFADVPVKNFPADVMPAVFAARPRDMEYAFDYWGGSAWIRDFSPLGAQVLHSAGREASTELPNFQATVILDFSSLLWSVANTPVQANPLGSFVDGWAPDHTPYVNHTYLSLQEFPRDWGGGPKGSLARFLTAGKSWAQQIHVEDLAQAVNGYSVLATRQPENVDPTRISFARNATGGNFATTALDEKRRGWWVAVNGAADYTLFVGADGTITQTPAMGGNLQNGVLAYWPEQNVLIAIDGGYESGQYASQSFRTIYVRDLASANTVKLSTTGPVPALFDGYDGTSKSFHRPDTTGLQWVSELGCMVGLDETVNPPAVVTLTPPAGGPMSGPWTWSTVTSLQHWPQDVGGQSQLQVGLNSAWSKFRWIPTLHAFVYMSTRFLKPQVVRL